VRRKPVAARTRCRGELRSTCDHWSSSGATNRQRFHLAHDLRPPKLRPPQPGGPAPCQLGPTRMINEYAWCEGRPVLAKQLSMRSGRRDGGEEQASGRQSHESPGAGRWHPHGVRMRSPAPRKSGRSPIPEAETRPWPPGSMPLRAQAHCSCVTESPNESSCLSTLSSRSTVSTTAGLH
jgi:hypothetical protein